MRIIKNLAQHKLVVLLIVVLLCVQAACDLALPNFTSDIVDTGIQQQGVQDVAAEQLTERTHDLVAMMLPESDEQMFANAYAQNEDGAYALTESGKRDRATLDSAMALPMTVTCYADQIPELDLDQVKAAYDQGMIGKADIQAMLDRARESSKVWLQLAPSTSSWATTLTPCRWTTWWQPVRRCSALPRSAWSSPS